jgi:hypothetical protein
LRLERGRGDSECEQQSCDAAAGVLHAREEQANVSAPLPRFEQSRITYFWYTSGCAEYELDRSPTGRALSWKHASYGRQN